MIKISNLNKYFFKGRQNEIHVINDVSMDLPASGMVAFFGKSGCGKTTLLNTIGGLDKYASGSVEIDGQSIRSKTDYIRNKYIGYIFQNYNLNLNVNNFENVAEALRLCGMKDEEEIKKRVIAALKNVGLENFAYRMPDTLSGGQKQRIAIARAIVKNPKIILADEPTGNLDEMNTIMIMNLLKAISKDHLVLLVTHEANLVDYYCDKVIELSDGKVMNIRENANANGYTAKDKNIIYLGEYEKEEAKVGRATLSCYGEGVPEDVHIQIVNRDGQLIVKVNSEKAIIIDEESEIELKEGVYVESEQQEDKLQKIDMDSLPEFEGKNYGKLFTFKKSLKESYNVLTKSTKKSSKALRNALILFAVVITFLTGSSSTSLEEYFKIKDSVNYDTFYVYAGKPELVKLLFDAEKNGDYGIDHVRINEGGSADEDIKLSSDIFSSFTYTAHSYFFSDIQPLEGHGVYLPESVCKDKTLICGTKEITGDGMIVSSRFADIVIKNSKYLFIKEYKDLLGVKMGRYGYRIVGIVEGDQPEVYIPELTLATNNNRFMKLVLDSEKEIKPGECIVVMNEGVQNDAIKIGNEIEADGLKLKIADIELIRKNQKEVDLQWIIDEGEPTYIEWDEDNGCYMAWYMDENGSGHGFGLTSEQFEMYTLYLQTGVVPGEDEGYSCHVSEDDYVAACKLVEATSEKVSMLIHTSNPEACEKFLRDNFDGQSLPEGIEYAVKSPEDVIRKDIDKCMQDVVDSYSVLFGFIVAMSLCVYMIMRSSVMSKIKEIGIYRSIGVTKKNIIYRYFIESTVLTSISVLPGYLVVIAFVKYMHYVSGITVGMYLPWWINIILIVVLYIASVVCGTLPTILLMQQTPSEIMAKYDV